MDDCLKSQADEEIRTLDPLIGKEMLYTELHPRVLSRRPDPTALSNHELAKVALGQPS